MSWQQPSVFVAAVALTIGCAQHLGMIERGEGWSTGVLFWPPPGATSRWIAEPSAPETLGDAASRIEGVLRSAGYAETRRIPIGARFEHGFAVTTRLERIGDHGAPGPPDVRWLSAYPEPATFKWLAGASETYLPAPGRYRVWLIAFTDLHPLPPGAPQRWDEATAMDGPDFLPIELPARRRAPAGSRVGVYLYEYVAKSRDGEGFLVRDDPRVPGATQMARSGLAALASPGSPNRER